MTLEEAIKYNKTHIKLNPFELDYIKATQLSIEALERVESQRPKRVMRKGKSLIFPLPSETEEVKK